MATIFPSVKVVRRLSCIATLHVLQFLQLNVSVEADVGSSSGDRLRKGHMDGLWQELQVYHLGGQVLSPRIVQSHVAVFTASNQ